MLLRILSEDETTAQLRDQIETLTTAQLLFLEEVIKREKQKRQRKTFNAWQDYLQVAEKQGLLPNKSTKTLS